MKKFLKMIPILVIGLIAALAAVGCASTGQDKTTEAASMSAIVTDYTVTNTDMGCPHNDWSEEVVAPTCTQQGYTMYTCASCGECYMDRFVEAKGHAFQDITIPATCTHKGYVTHFCMTCGYEYTDSFVNEKGHTYSDEVIAPTCTEPGYTMHTCSVCGSSYKDSYVEALGHDYLEVVTEPTCTESGYTTYTCQTCANEVVSDHTDAKGHTYSETVHRATCVSYGYTEHLCSECGDRYVTDYQKATGHIYLDIVVEATPDSLGYTRHLCIVCNYSYLSDFVTSGDDGYVEEETPKPVHEHKYKFHVQNFEADKYFIALRVCICGDSKVGNLNIQLSDADGETMQLTANEYGKVDYADLYGDWLVTILDQNGEQLSMFDISAGEISKEPTQPESPDKEEEPSVPETPDVPDGGEDIQVPGDGQEPQAPELSDDMEDSVNPGDGGSDEETLEGSQEPANETEGNSDSTAVILLIVFALLVAGGIGAVIFLKKRKNKDQN